MENHTSIKEPSFKKALSLPRNIIESVDRSAYSASMILFSASKSTVGAEVSSSLLIAHLSWLPGNRVPGNPPVYILPLPRHSLAYCPVQRWTSRHAWPLSRKFQPRRTSAPYPKKL